MQIFKDYIALLLFILSSCNNLENEKVVLKPQKIGEYKQTPAFIKKFLDSSSRGHFFIADRGEEWNGGCVVSQNLPSYKFISATLTKDQYKLKFWHGGFVTVQEMIVINFSGKKIIGYFRDEIK